MSTISASTTTTTAYKVTADTTGTLVLQTGATPTTAITIDGSQNVGITGAPNTWSLGKAIEFGTAGAALWWATSSNVIVTSNMYYNGAYKYAATGPASFYQQYNGAHNWQIAASGTAGTTATFTQAMTLDASGKLGVGTTTPQNKFNVSNAGAAGLEINPTLRDGTTAGAFLLSYNRSGAAYVPIEIDASDIRFKYSNTEAARFTSSGQFLLGSSAVSAAPAGTIVPLGYRGRQGTGGTEVNNFNIAWNGSGANLWIDTSNTGVITVVSDYRIKKNIETQTIPAIERVMRLRPVTYEIDDYGDLFKADGVQREGFIAHEVQEVISSGAEGHKDEENRIQSLRVDAIVSVLTKAIQEQQAIIQAQAADIAALKAKVGI